MSTRYHERFFDSVSDQSGVKLRIYRTYLAPWAAKLGSNPRTKRLVIVDGFAGRGRYKDGTPGSPEVAMQLAHRANAEGRSYRVQCMFGESRLRHQATLRELIGRYPAASAPLIEDDFWERIDDVVQFVGEDPCLLFIDPFGLAGLNFERLAELIQRLGPKVDLLVNLRTPAAVRLAPAMRQRVTAAVGSDDWTADTVSSVFRRNLAAVGGFLPPAALQIRERLEGRLHTELVLASRSPDAYELWNDEIVKEVERLTAEDALGESERTRDRNIALVAERLRKSAGEQSTWRRRDAINWHVVEFCGDAHTGTVKRAHASLIGSFAEALNPQAGIEDQVFRKR